MRKKKAVAITTATAMYLVKRGYAVSTEVGLESWGRRRADVVGLKTDTTICLVEVKSCYQDFSTDKKWRSYLNWSNIMYFAVYEDDYEAWGDKLKAVVANTGVGILILERNGWVSAAVNAKYRKMKNKKALIVKLAYRNSPFIRGKTRRLKVFIEEDK